MKFATSLALALPAVPGTAGPAAADDGDAPPPKAQWEQTWTISQAGKATAELWLSGIVSATDVQYVSGHVQPVGKDAVRTVFHEQRDPGGLIKKYRRYQEVRLGKGVMAFASGDALRLVGIKQKLAPVVLGGATRHLLHDPVAPQMLDLVARFLARSKAEVSFPVVDMGSRKSRTVVARPGAPSAVTDAKGARREVAVWTLAGLDGPVTLFVDGKLLVGAKLANRALLLKGWSWGVAAPVAAEPAAKPADREAAGAPTAAVPAGDGAAEPGASKSKSKPSTAPDPGEDEDEGEGESDEETGEGP